MRFHLTRSSSLKDVFGWYTENGKRRYALRLPLTNCINVDGLSFVIAHNTRFGNGIVPDIVANDRRVGLLLQA